MRIVDPGAETAPDTGSVSGPAADKKKAIQDDTQTGLEGEDFDEEDESLLDLISGYGQEEAAKAAKDNTPMAKKVK